MGQGTRKADGGQMGGWVPKMGTKEQALRDVLYGYVLANIPAYLPHTTYTVPTKSTL